MTRIVGIDPGVSGAVALLEDGGFVAVEDLPTIVRSKSAKSTKRMINGAELARIIREWSPNVAIIELVNAMPPKGSRRCPACNMSPYGSAAAFNFGESSGVIRGVVAALGIAAHYVTPQVWKRRATLSGSDKEASRMLAVTLWPEAPLGRKKDQGRAEALLIARFGVAAFDADPVKADPFRLAG